MASSQIAYREITPTDNMRTAALRLNTGPLVYVYQDGTAIRCETADGIDPYVWRGDHWQRMRMRT